MLLKKLLKFLLSIWICNIYISFLYYNYNLEYWYNLCFNMPKRMILFKKLLNVFYILKVISYNMLKTKYNIDKSIVDLSYYILDKKTISFI